MEVWGFEVLGKDFDAEGFECGGGLVGLGKVDKHSLQARTEIASMYKPVEAFKTDLEGSPSEAIDERCKVGSITFAAMAGQIITFAAMAGQMTRFAVYKLRLLAAAMKLGRLKRALFNYECYVFSGSGTINVRVGLSLA
ncbi:hypothetical protein Tco_0392366 [Tanacetum coccineum]